MKVKRLKRAARVLTFFRYNFGYQAPHSVLLDGTFCQAALQNKINLGEQMPKYLADPVQMFSTECVLNELEQLGKPLHGAHVICQQFPVAKCPHRPLRTAAECVAHLARRSKKAGHTKWFVATQDDALLEKLRELGGIPLMSIRFNTILLEKPSDKSKQQAESGEATDELVKVRELRNQLLGEQGKRHRKRKAKGPNPLSCKKKKAKTPTMTTIAGQRQQLGKQRDHNGKADLLEHVDEAGNLSMQQKAGETERRQKTAGNAARELHQQPISAAEKEKRRRIRKRLLAKSNLFQQLEQQDTSRDAS